MRPLVPIKNRPGNHQRLKPRRDYPGGVSPKQILQGWPIALAPAARLWVDANLIDGAISNVDFAMDIPIGADQSWPRYWG